MKPVNPYITLRNKMKETVSEAKEWVRAVLHPTQVCTFYYGKSDIETVPYKLFDLRERVIVADQLGYDTLLKWNPDKGLMVILKKRPPMVPWEIRP